MRDYWKENQKAREKAKAFKGIRGLNPYLAASLKQLDDFDKELVRRGFSPMLHPLIKETIYNNDAYVNKYGKKDFLSTTPEYRNYRWKEDLYKELLQPLFHDLTNPFIEDEDGNTLIDPKKGLGMDYFKYNSMDWLGKQEFLDAYKEGRYLFPDEIKAKQDERDKTILRLPDEEGKTDDAFVPVEAMMGYAGTKLIGGDDIINYTETAPKQNVLDNIYFADQKRKEKAVAPAVEAYKKKHLEGLSKQDIIKRFLAEIQGTDTRQANRFAAYFDENGNSDSSEVGKVDEEQMADFIAKKAVYDQYFGEEVSADILNRLAEEYIHENQSPGAYISHLSNDIWISVASYTADKYNSIRRLGISGKALVFIDTKNGNVVSTDDVFQGEDGNYYAYNRDSKGQLVQNNELPEKNEDGEYQQKDGYLISKVEKTEMDKIALDDMGLDENGNKRGWFENMLFWTDAELFLTMDEEELEKYKKIGYSPYQVVWKPGDDTHIFYDTAKMFSFAIADVTASAALSMASGGGGWIAKGGLLLSKAAQTLSRGSKVLSATGKVISTIGNEIALGSQFLGEVVSPVVAATGIGSAYGRGKFQENLYDNYSKVELRIYDYARQDILNNKPLEISNRTEELYQKAIKEYAINIGQPVASIDEYTKLEIREQASFLAVNELTQEAVDKWKKENPEEYAQAKAEAIDNASTGALAAAYTTAIKYTAVNFGWRNFMFKSPAARKAALAKAAEKKGISKTFTPEGKERLGYANKYLTKLDKLKLLGKTTANTMWNGAWTNFTDELQSWGGVYINRDLMDDYLEGMFDPEAKAASVQANTGVLNNILKATGSYFKGAMHGLAEPHSWEAGLVGGLGSAVSFSINPMGLLQINKKASKGENISYVISNSILNDFYNKVASTRNTSNAVAYLNAIMDNQDDFSALDQLYAADFAKKTPMDKHEAKASDLLDAVDAMHLLHTIQVDPLMAETAKSSAVILKAMDTVEKLLPENQKKLSEEEKTEILQQYYKQNPSVATNEETAEQAFEIMGLNATALKEAGLKVFQATEHINKIEKAQDKKLSPQLRRALTRMYLVDDLTKQQMEENNEIIGVTDKSSTIPTFDVDVSSDKKATRRAESYGNRQHLQTAEKGISKLAKKAADLVTVAKEAAKLAEQALKSYDEKNPLVDPKDKKRAKLQDDYDEKVFALNAAKKVAQLYSDEAGVLNESLSLLEEGEEVPVLSEEDILHMDPVDRARILNPKNRDRFSPEQQRVIESLEEQLRARNPEALETIQRQATLATRREWARNSIDLMINSPEGFELQSDLQQQLVDEMAAEIVKENQRANIKQSVDQIIEGGKEKDASQEEVSDLIYKQLRVLNPSILEDMIESGEFSHVKDELGKAYSWSKLVNTVTAALGIISEGMKGSKKTKESFEKDIIKAAEDATTAEEVISNLEELAKEIPNDKRNASKKKYYERILKKVTQLQAQANSKTRDRAKEARRAKQIEKQKRKAERRKEELKKLARSKMVFKEGDVVNYDDASYIVSEVDEEFGVVTLVEEGNHKNVIQLSIDKVNKLHTATSIENGRRLINSLRREFNDNKNPEGLTVDAEESKRGEVLYKELTKAETFDDLLRSERMQLSPVHWSPTANKLMEALFNKLKKDSGSIRPSDLNMLFDDTTILSREKVTTVPVVAKKGDIFHTLRKNGKTFTIKVTSISEVDGEQQVNYKFVNRDGTISDKEGQMPLSRLKNWNNVTNSFVEGKGIVSPIPKSKESKKSEEAEKSKEEPKKKEKPKKEDIKEEKEEEQELKEQEEEKEAPKEEPKEEPKAALPEKSSKIKIGDRFKWNKEEGRSYEITVKSVDEKSGLAKVKINNETDLSTISISVLESGTNWVKITDDESSEGKKETTKKKDSKKEVEEDIEEDETDEEDIEEEQDSEEERKPVSSEPQVGDVYTRKVGEREYSFTVVEIDGDTAFVKFENNDDIQTISIDILKKNWHKLNTENEVKADDSVSKSSKPPKGVNTDNVEELDTLDPEDEMEDVPPGEVELGEEHPYSGEEEDDDMPEVEPATLLGNGSPGYAIPPLKGKDNKKMIPRKETTTSARLLGFYDWLETNGIQLLEIIDNELAAISKLNPDIKFLRVNPRENEYNDRKVERYIFLVVKYDEKISRIHKKERGGVIEANDGKWLIIGTMGYRGGETEAEEKELATDMRTTVTRKGYRYFLENPKKRFYVDGKMHTKIKRITPGLIATHLPTDTGNKKNRPISELLNDPERNPRGISLIDTKWLISGRKKSYYVRVSDKSKVLPIRDKERNVGKVFILIPGANGQFIPVAINPISVGLLKEGSTLREEISTLVLNLRDPSHKVRLDTLYKLRQYLNFGKNSEYNILVGTKASAWVTIKRGTTTIHTFDLNDSSISASDIVDAVFSTPMLVLIGLGTLTNKLSLQKYDEAGALLTDVARLAAVNSSYSIIACNPNGEPIMVSTSGNTESKKGNSEYRGAAHDSVKVEGLVYRFNPEEQIWYNEEGQQVTDEALIELNNYNREIETRDLVPFKTRGSWDYFILDDSKDNPIVVKRNGLNNKVEQLSKKQSQNLIKEENKKELEKQRLEAAERAYEEVTEAEAKNLEEVNLGLEESDYETAEEEDAEEDAVSISAMTDTILPDSMKKGKKKVKETVKEEKEEDIDQEEDEIEDSEPPAEEEKPTKKKAVSDSLLKDEEKGSFTVFDIYNSEYYDEFESILELKEEELGWEIPDDVNEMAEYLEEKIDIDMSSIKSIREFLDILRACRN